MNEASAQRASRRTLARIERALPGAVRMTRSLDHAREVIRAEVAAGRDLIVFGGGDGTAVMGLTLIDEACRGYGRPEPAIGVLRMGSGNAIADAVEASREPARDLELLAAGARWRSLPMVTALGMRTPFVGIGLDAQLLDDQRVVGDIVDRVPLAKRFVGGRARYALSVATRSLPRFATAQRPHASVVNTGAPAIELARGGPTGRTIPSGAVMWQGDVTLVAAATITSFGFGLKMFAFAAMRPDRFQLRCGDGGLFEVLRHVPAAFRGRYFSEHVRDFLCDRVKITVDSDVVVEAGGELLPAQRELEIALGRPATVATVATHAAR